jgi:hypothetical protein
MSVWTQASGTLATIQENVQTSVSLPIIGGTDPQIISGNIPAGMSLSGREIIGTPEEVIRSTDYRFVIRSFDNAVPYDRTFTITVQGADSPVWVTPEDLLPVGKNDTFYILDSAPVDYQLVAIDSDTAAGQQLSYFIASDDGELPPGISLREDGRLQGIVDPILALEKDAAKGYYDESKYDKYPYDFSILDTAGFDSFFYDTAVFDFANPVRTPKKLNRFYEFTVTASDGYTTAKRTFRIFVVGDDFLRADNTVMQVGTGIFTADNTYVRTPIWLTPSKLGFKRANNFTTVFLDVIDPNTLQGTVVYRLQNTNPGVYRIKSINKEIPGRFEISGKFPKDPETEITYTDTDDFETITPETESILPPGLEIDENTGEIFGRIPYQTAVTREFTFTVKAIRQTIRTTETATNEKTFTLNVLGEVDSTITWLTDTNLGTVTSNYISLLKVEAVTNVPNAFLLYTLENGSLPPGLTLNFNGEISGRIDNSLVSNTTEYQFTIKARDQFRFSAIERQFTLTVEKENLDYSNVFYQVYFAPEIKRRFNDFISNPAIFDPELIYRPFDSNFGLQRDNRILVYAGIERALAEKYVAIAARYAKRKTLKINDVKTAVAKLPGSNETLYEVVYLDLIDDYSAPELEKNKTISTNREITADIVDYNKQFTTLPNDDLNNITLEFREQDKKLYFDSQIKVDTRQGSVYWNFFAFPFINARDNAINVAYEARKSTNITFRPDNANSISVDSNLVKVSDFNRIQKYISNINSLRNDIRTLGETESDFLPLWMRTAQTGANALGYTLAFPLCFCKPGTSQIVESAIRLSNFDVREFEMDVDRFVIDSTEDNDRAQFVVFANYEFNL